MKKKSKLIFMILSLVVLIYYVQYEIALDYQNKLNNYIKRNQIPYQFESLEIRDQCTEWRSMIKSLNTMRNASIKVEDNKNQATYYLSALLLVRIYSEDKANLQTRELRQWLRYLFYAGVHHVYVYDAYVKPSERQEELLADYIQIGLVSYIDWSSHNPYTMQGTQVKAYQHAIDNYKITSDWHIAIDIDEYPFSPSDFNPGFLTRFVQELSASDPSVSEITMQNYLFLGDPDKEKMWLIERIERRTPHPANNLVKPIYRPQKVSANLHHNNLKSGRSVNADDSKLRMQHYWGARLQNWGPDTAESLKLTEPCALMSKVSKAVKECHVDPLPFPF